MLAERKTKKKYTINPRGNEWANNDSKFGQKLIEKMGWSKGKGLGKNEDGIVECIRASTQMDRKGVGSVDSAGDNWITAQDEYSAILANLNQAYGTTNGGKKENEFTNLEEKCKSSTSRIYYSKTIKSKNLSTKSKKDIDCILGRFKKGKDATGGNVKDEEKQDDNEKEEAEKQKSDEPGNLIKGSIDIYKIYAQKMAAFREKKFKITKNVEEYAEKSEEVSEECSDPSESPKTSESVEELDGVVCKASEKKKKKKKNDENVEAVVEVTKEKKKKRKRDEVDGDEVVDQNINDIVQAVEDDYPKPKKVKKSKTKSASNVERTTNGDIIVNSDNNIDDGCVSNKINDEEAAESGADQKKSKKKKKKDGM